MVWQGIYMDLQLFRGMGQTWKQRTDWTDYGGCGNNQLAVKNEDQRRPHSAQRKFAPSNCCWLLPHFLTISPEYIACQAICESSKPKGLFFQCPVTCTQLRQLFRQPTSASCWVLVKAAERCSSHPPGDTLDVAKHVKMGMVSVWVW